MAVSSIRKYEDQPAPDVTSGRVAITDGNLTEVIPANGSRQLMMDSFSIVNTSTTDVYVDILSGANIIWSTSAPNKGGSNMPFPKPIPMNPGDPINARVSSGVNAIIVSIGAHVLERPIAG